MTVQLILRGNLSDSCSKNGEIPRQVRNLVPSVSRSHLVRSKPILANELGQLVMSKNKRPTEEARSIRRALKNEGPWSKIFEQA